MAMCDLEIGQGQMMDTFLKIFKLGQGHRR